MGYWSIIAVPITAFLGVCMILVLLSLFQWFGYALGLSMFVVPWAIIVHRRQQRAGELDDKNFANSEDAIDWWIKKCREVKR